MSASFEFENNEYYYSIEVIRKKEGEKLKHLKFVCALDLESKLISRDAFFSSKNVFARNAKREREMKYENMRMMKRKVISIHTLFWCVFSFTL